MAEEKKKKITYPDKKTMNLYYKPDRTTIPATVALYVLFGLTLLLAFGKFFVYDILEKLEETREELARAQQELNLYEERLTDYDEVLHRYRMYSATDEEESQTDRMEVLSLLDEVVRPQANISSISVSGGFVNVRFTGVTLRKTAEIVRELERSPIVYRTSIDTAATVESSGAEKTSGSGEYAGGAEESAGSGEYTGGAEEGAGAGGNADGAGESAGAGGNADGAGESAGAGENADGAAESAGAGENADGAEEGADFGENAGGAVVKGNTGEGEEESGIGSAAAGDGESAERSGGARDVRTGGNEVTANILISLEKENGEGMKE